MKRMQRVLATLQGTIARRTFAAICVITFNLLLLEGAARFYAFIDQPVLSTNQHFDVKYFLMQHLNYAGKKNLFLVGDSAMNRAIYPDLLSYLLAKHKLQVQVVNFAINGGNAYVTTRLLDAAFKLKKVKPDLVICNYLPQSGFLGDRATQQLSLKELSSINRSYLGRCILCQPRHGLSAIVCAAENNSYLFRNRGYLKSRIEDFIHAACSPQSFEWKSQKSFSDWSMSPTNLGWNPNNFIMTPANYSVLAKTPQMTQSWKSMQRELRTGKYSVNLKFYEPITQFCMAHNIPLYIVWLPYYAPFFESNFFSKDYPQSLESAQLAGLNDPNKRVFTGEIKGLNDEPGYFNDPVGHMSSYGAVRATEKLAEMLASEPYRSLLSSQPSKESISL